ITTLINRKFIEENGKTVISTKTGREVYKMLPAEIKTADMTAYWWAIQEDIIDGIKEPKDLINSVLGTVNRIIEETPRNQIIENSSAGKVATCPKCGSDILEAKKVYFCSNKECECMLLKEDKYFLAMAGRKVSRTMAMSLFNTGKILVKGLVSKKSGKKYDAIVNADFSENFPKYSLSFPEKKKAKTSKLKSKYKKY
ncbi:MAG: hypothetical protein ACRCUS_00370, partial [Anaerovoracaceae bacterium]